MSGQIFDFLFLYLKQKNDSFYYLANVCCRDVTHSGFSLDKRPFCSLSTSLCWTDTKCTWCRRNFPWLHCMYREACHLFVISRLLTFTFYQFPSSFPFFSLFVFNSLKTPTAFFIRFFLFKIFLIEKGADFFEFKFFILKFYFSLNQ